MNKQKILSIRLYNTKEVAEFLGVSERTIYDWVYKKEIPYHKVGKLLRFDLDEINAWVKKAV